LAPNWSGPFLITKIRDNGNIRIQLDKKEINVNVNRIKPFIDTKPEKHQQQQQPQPQQQQPQPQAPSHQPIVEEHYDQKEEEQPWFEVKRQKH
jgi:hypothetical protein